MFSMESPIPPIEKSPELKHALRSIEIPDFEALKATMAEHPDLEKDTAVIEAVTRRVVGIIRTKSLDLVNDFKEVFPELLQYEGVEGAIKDMIGEMLRIYTPDAIPDVIKKIPEVIELPGVLDMIAQKIGLVDKKQEWLTLYPSDIQQRLLGLM